MLEDILRVVVWSFFVERLLQSALVGWGQSGRVRPVEQVSDKNFDVQNGGTFFIVFYYVYLASKNVQSWVEPAVVCCSAEYWLNGHTQNT